MIFIDSDDFITKTALEELYYIAKKFDADVVHCDRYYTFKDDEKKITVKGHLAGGYVNEPTLITDNQIEKLNDLYQDKFVWALWECLIRRDFLVKNNLELTGVRAHDKLLMWAMVLSAKKFVRVPNIINFYRLHPNSYCSKVVDVEEKISRIIQTLTETIRWFNNFLSKQKFFETRPDLKFMALEGVTKARFQELFNLYLQVPTDQLNKLIRRELDKTEHKIDFVIFLLHRMNVFNLNLNRQGAVIQQLQEQIKQLKS